LLARCYTNCLDIARQNEMQSIAFPCISTGVYGYPSEAAAEVAIATVGSHLAAIRYECDVIFCCFAFQDFQTYRRLLKHIPPVPGI
jgi:O-acetyl-ADP-ribose deacetylase (regulator of RNase III)